MEDILVSIVVPTYNVENYLSRAIESSLAQSYPYIQLVLVDDGSTDGTWKIIEKYAAKDRRIVAKAQKNAGVSTARNQGLALADGDYVLFLDSDDWLEPDTVETLLKLQRDHAGKLVSAGCFFAYLKQDGTICKKAQDQEQEEACLTKEESLVAVAEGRYSLTSSCYKLYSRKVIEENGLRFDRAIRHGEDGLFVFCYLRCVEGLFWCHTPLWNILDRPGSATTGGYNRYWRTAIDAVEEMLRTETSPFIRKKLYKLLVRRTIVVLFEAVRSGGEAKEDIAFARKKLWGVAGRYLPGDDTVKHKVLYFIALLTPPPLLKKCLIARDQRLAQNNP